MKGILSTGGVEGIPSSNKEFPMTGEVEGIPSNRREFPMTGGSLYQST